MKKVIIIGAGIGGCAAALALSRKGYKVLVLEKLETIFTNGAGICLYSNALKSLDELGVLPEVLGAGFSMKGNTEFLNNNSEYIGSIIYKSIDNRYPAYVGINRQQFLEILYNRACQFGAEFRFNSKISSIDQIENTVSVTLDEGTKFFDYELLIAADGTNSKIRQKYWMHSESIYSGFGLWHSMHNLHKDVDEKVTVILNDRRFGIIPISNTQMYIWASLKQPVKTWIPEEEQAASMYKEFKNVNGFLKEIIDQLILNPYVHYTAVEEVTLDTFWHRGRIVLLGDAAHASLPFMAQGGAMALQDAVVLSKVLAEYSNVDEALRIYFNKRKPVVDTVQQMCRKIGSTYSDSLVNLNRAQQGLNSFYGNKEFF